MAVIAGVAEAEPLILDDPAPFVSFEGFGHNTLNLRLRCYLDDMEKRLVTSTRLHTAINRAFAEAGIVIAFPQRDVHLDSERPFRVVLESGSRDQAPPLLDT
jgi:potassium efflux system protein